MSSLNGNVSMENHTLIPTSKLTESEFTWPTRLTSKNPTPRTLVSPLDPTSSWISLKKNSSLPTSVLSDPKRRPTPMLPPPTLPPLIGLPRERLPPLRTREIVVHAGPSLPLPPLNPPFSNKKNPRPVPSPSNNSLIVPDYKEIWDVQEVLWTLPTDTLRREV